MGEVFPHINKYERLAHSILDTNKRFTISEPRSPSFPNCKEESALMQTSLLCVRGHRPLNPLSKKLNYGFGIALISKVNKLVITATTIGMTKDLAPFRSATSLTTSFCPDSIFSILLSIELI